jgi:hypothetical protein
MCAKKLLRGLRFCPLDFKDLLAVILGLAGHFFPSTALSTLGGDMGRSRRRTPTAW